MTTLDEARVKCQVCGNISEHPCVISTSMFGAPDLDTRPPEVQRSTLPYWVQACPSCGYCAQELTDAIPGAAERVREAAYAAQLHERGYPELADRFLCWSLLLERAGQLELAGKTSLYAAWACDDAQEDAAARKCRTRAVALYEQALARGEAHFDQVAAEDCLLADLLRRSGEFAPASARCVAGLAKHPPKVVENALAYEKVLIMAKDTQCHSMAEVKAKFK